MDMSLIEERARRREARLAAERIAAEALDLDVLLDKAEYLVGEVEDQAEGS
ncbi:hypothetical protein SRB5_45420 [Streptomyces sp. RB5]|uniref:Uncharacterized protein n=1 Tax=Streptomyces smaragdinus TaxID=2585196 RepID=A0A7K0CLL6_9ACTN|nr:hypothetical protein [Streptomyces smaragdinus]MQY14376.1 hypothetical protein [Streptomyces smaragdinus]